MGSNYREVIEDFFLFTIVGTLFGKDYANFFALGDGFVRINDVEHKLGPFPRNAPPYAAYALIEDNIEIDPKLIKIGVIDQLPLKEVDHYLIGTDGVHDLANAASRLVPGSVKPVGPLDQFWQNQKHYKNKAMISRRLGMIARDWPLRAPDPGLLPDDTTLITGVNTTPFPEQPTEAEASDPA
jgi:hypothetical protein